MHSLKNYENNYFSFFMIFKSLMGLGKPLCNFPSGTTQGWVCLQAKETYMKCVMVFNLCSQHIYIYIYIV